MQVREQNAQPVIIMVSSTVLGPNTTMLMTVYTGATIMTTGASFWQVPAGKVFRVQAMNIVGVSSAVLSNARLLVMADTAAASMSVTSTVGVVAALPFAIQASTTPFQIQIAGADVGAQTTIALGIAGGTSHSMLGAVVQGIIF
jgi:hypothetical protein